MPSLLELQVEFAAALFDDADTGPPATVAGERMSAAERFGIYRASVFGNYRKALRAVYPVVERLVGGRFFDHAADAFARAHPSRSGDLNRYGEGFADFLASFPGADMLAYLADTARLEWAVEEVFHAAEVAPQPLQRLAGIAEADYPALRLRLDPGCRLLDSRWPVDRLWELNQPDAVWDEGFDIDAGGTSLLVRRSAFQVELVRLPAAEFALLAELAKGATLGEGCALAHQRDPEWPLGEALQRHLLEATLRLDD